MIFPGVAMVIFVVAFNLLGDSVRDAFDPKSGALTVSPRGKLPPGRRSRRTSGRTADHYDS